MDKQVKRNKLCFGLGTLGRDGVYTLISMYFITYLTETGKLETLPEELRTTAKLRMEHNQLSLSDLAKLTNPPVTKSGMKHRLEKILSCADDIRAAEENNRN